jgi:ABC-2 type transport system permease protein
MNGALFRSGLRQTAGTVGNYGVGMLCYLLLFIGVYPSFAHAKALNALLKSLPSGLLRVLGYNVGVTHLAGFLGGEFYSLIYLLIFGIFAIFAATKMVAHLIDNGTMAHLLATQVSRRGVAVTQALVLLVDTVVIGAVTTVGALLGAHWLVHQSGLDVGAFVRLNIVGTLLFAVVGAYSFLFSCVAPDERTALSWSAVLTLLFYGLRVVGDMARGARWMGHLSLFDAFNSQQLIHGEGPFVLDALGLAVAAAALLIVAVVGLERRQLSL